jgi:OmcA/MtrC family decaheme c-type cytochrome
MWVKSIPILLTVLGLGIVGCKGEPGADGADGANGQDGINGTDGVDGVDGADGADGADGEDGEDVTIAPAGTTGLDLTLHSLESTANGETYDVVLTFSITRDGVPYVDSDGVIDESNGLSELSQSRFYAVQYDPAAGTFDNSLGFDRQTITNIEGMPGYYTITYSGASYAPETTDAFAYGYVGDDPLDVESMTLYDFVSNAVLTFGDTGPDSYESAANVAGCEKCHGAPYMKHGYRAAEVEGVSDFAICKTCHYDTRTGGHEDWQILVDDPLRYTELDAGDELTAEEEAYYAYTANVMNDVHMAHAMEFAYPQRMSNCVTCHEGKLEAIQAEENFTMETCRSCHPVTGSEEYETAEHSLTTIWENANVSSYHAVDSDCAACHVGGGAAEHINLSTLHNGGFEPMVFTADGTRYSDAFTVSIDSASYDADTYELTVEVTVTEDIDVDGLDVEDVEPDIRAAVYGYESKDFYGYESGDETDNGGGSWSAVIDLSDYAGEIGEDEAFRRVEIVVRPSATVVVGDLDEDDESDCGEGAGEGCEDNDYYCSAGECIAEDDIGVTVTSPSRTFDLSANAFDDGYYEEIVDVAKCNDCHEALAITFHSPNRSGNIVTCRMCHKPNSAGSHLELQSRSLDSYVHAIHSFQVFDTDDIDFTDPVEALHYEHHIESTFPNFTAKNCEACHNEGTYEVPDQAMTLPGLLSSSYEVDDRSIADVDRAIVGPTARSCGACHRSHLINEDDASQLLSFNQHTKANGYGLAEDDGVYDSVMETIMSYFGLGTAAEDTGWTGADVAPESCETCHGGAGEAHQAVYDAYADTN